MRIIGFVLIPDDVQTSLCSDEREENCRAWEIAMNFISDRLSIWSKANSTSSRYYSHRATIGANESTDHSQTEATLGGPRSRSHARFSRMFDQARIAHSLEFFDVAQVIWDASSQVKQTERDSFAMTI